MAIERAPRSPLHEEFGRRVRKRRQAMGLSQEAFAEESGIARAYVGQVETGMRNVSLNNLGRIARALNVDLGTLLKGLQKFDGQT
ncbi:MAG: helix-turn-helix domain-containing protein [Acidimicrobiales bacterium]